MKSYLHRTIRLSSLCVALVLVGSSNVAAQEPDLDKLAKRLSAQLAKAGINSVVVADFATAEGKTSPAGFYLAGELSQSLGKNKRTFSVIDRIHLTEALDSAKILPRDLAESESLYRIGASLNVDAVVAGTLETTTSRYSVKVIVRSVKDASVLITEDESVKRPAIADGMVLLASRALPEQLSVAGQNGVGTPTCDYCPTPVYSKEARAAKLQGDVILVAIVTLEGRTGETAVINAPDLSLARRATETLTHWKLKPATDRNGKPVSVLVPIEVTFRLY